MVPKKLFAVRVSFAWQAHSGAFDTLIHTLHSMYCNAIAFARTVLRTRPKPISLGSRRLRAKKSAELVSSFFLFSLLWYFLGDLVLNCSHYWFQHTTKWSFSMPSVLGKTHTYAHTNYAEFSPYYRIQSFKREKGKQTGVLLLISFCLLSFITSQLELGV